jgi:polyphosphate:AMP phosphotransferase
MFEVAELGQKLSKRDFEEQVPALRRSLLEAQERLRDADFRVVIVIAGVEGAGKGETVNTLLEWLDARGIDAHALGGPTQEETERPPLFRFWRRLPAVGEMAIFFGSWYTSPIVDHVFGRIDDDSLDRELERIDDFERMLVDENTLLLKFWLHISKKQQKHCFEKLESDPDTAWRVSPADWEYHQTYDEFVVTSERAIRRTNTAHAPWDIVEARNKRFRHATVARRLLDALSQRLESRPTPPAEPPPLPVPSELNVLRALDLGVSLSREKYERELSRQQGRLGRLSRRMSEAGCSAVMVFEGVDAGGKGGCIRRVVHALDARFYHVVAIAAPSDEESARPYLWRFWRHLPRRGHFTVYDRSWYGRVLVERIEGLCPPEACQRAYAEINAFEEQLVEAGTRVFKFWLAISPEEQLRRFEARRSTTYKRYKLTPEDWRNREKWLAYEAAACDMVEKTSTGIAPWTLVEAEDKLHARIKVLETICAGLEEAVGPDRKPTRGQGGKRKRSG